MTNLKTILANETKKPKLELLINTLFSYRITNFKLPIKKKWNARE